MINSQTLSLFQNNLTISPSFIRFNNRLTRLVIFPNSSSCVTKFAIGNDINTNFSNSSGYGGNLNGKPAKNSNKSITSTTNNNNSSAQNAHAQSSSSNSNANIENEYHQILEYLYNLVKEDHNFLIIIDNRGTSWTNYGKAIVKSLVAIGEKRIEYCFVLTENKLINKVKSSLTGKLGGKSKSGSELQGSGIVGGRLKFLVLKNFYQRKQP